MRTSKQICIGVADVTPPALPAAKWPENYPSGSGDGRSPLGEGPI